VRLAAAPPSEQYIILSKDRGHRIRSPVQQVSSTHWCVGKGIFVNLDGVDGRVVVICLGVIRRSLTPTAKVQQQPGAQDEGEGHPGTEIAPLSLPAAASSASSEAV
jgi:hypothetical protein